MRLKVKFYKIRGRSLTQRWKYQIIGGNGEDLFHSEPYFSKWNARRSQRKFWPTAQEVDE